MSQPETIQGRVGDLASTLVDVPRETVGYRTLHAALDEAWQPASSALPVEVVLRASTPDLAR